MTPPAIAPLPDLRQAAWIRRRQRRSSSWPLNALDGAAVIFLRRLVADFFAALRLVTFSGDGFLAVDVLLRLLAALVVALRPVAAAFLRALLLAAALPSLSLPLALVRRVAML